MKKSTSQGMKKVHWKSIKKSLYIRYWVFRICMRKASSSTPMYLTELWRVGKNWQEKWDSKLGPRLELYPKSIYFSFQFFLLGCSEKKMPVMILSIVIGTLSMYTEQLCCRVGLGLVIVPQNVNSLSIWINIRQWWKYRFYIRISIFFVAKK